MTTPNIAVDAVTIARREVEDIDSPDPAIRRLAIATLAQAVHEMQLADPEATEYCARITRSNGALIDRYATHTPTNPTAPRRTA